MNNHSPTSTARRTSVTVPPAIRARFIAPAITAFTVFSLYGFYFSLAPGVLIESLHLSNRAIGGAVVFELGLVAAATLALLIAAQAMGSLPLLLLGTALSGISGALGIGNSLPVIAVAVLTRAFDSLVADSVFAITLAVLALGALAASLRMPAIRIP